VSIGIAFQKRLGAGLFGGEGFIMQKLEGDGQVYIHAGGTTVQRELAPGEMLRVDTGCLVAMTQTVEYDIQFVGGIKNTLFGGEGFFFAHAARPRSRVDPEPALQPSCGQHHRCCAARGWPWERGGKCPRRSGTFGMGITRVAGVAWRGAFTSN
jgi:hypothetical protein